MESWMTTTVFKIEGLNCDAYANTIRNLSKRNRGCAAAVSFTERQARMTRKLLRKIG
jgi:hypothetical protein